VIGQVDAAADRHRRIVDRLDADGRVEVGELSGRFGVAQETIRRDLRLLEAQGLLERVHGGAVKRTERPLSPFDGTTPEHPPLHLRLAELVIERLPDCSTLLLAASPLTWAVAEVLSRHPPALAGTTVVTSSLDVAVVLSRVEHLQVYNVGGSVEPEHRAQQGNWALEEIRRFRVDLALVTPSGLPVEDGVFADSAMAAAVTSAEMEIAERVWLLMNGADVGRAGAVLAGDLTHVDHVFTTGAVDSQRGGSVAEAGITVISAD
jgi:DeoR/GlpR family transcriptional regulator of sugar metabolism